MKKLIIIFIISVNVILYSKELHIYINETIKTIDTSKENPMQNIDSSKIELFLGNNYFYTISNDEKNLYDFKIKKIYNINLKNKIVQGIRVLGLVDDIFKIILIFILYSHGYNKKNKFWYY